MTTFNHINNIKPDRALRHRIWALAWPMIVSNISIPLLGLVDTAILGHLEHSLYLGAVAVGSSILLFVYWGFSFLRMGTTGLTAQAYGAEQHNKNRLIVAQAIIAGFCLGLIIIASSPLLIRFGLLLVAPPEDAYELALTYLNIRIFSAPAVLINYAITGWFIGQQNTRLPLVIALLTNGLNIVLDCIFILGLGMKSEGAALATLLAEYSGCGLAVIFLWRQLARTPGTLNKSALKKLHHYQHLFEVNRHLFVRTVLLLASFAFFTAQGAQMGETLLAANAILLNLLFVTAYGLDGFAHAAEALAGNSIGKQQIDRFLAVCIGCFQYSLVTAAIFTLVFWLGQAPLLNLLTSLEPVQQAVLDYYPWLLILPLISVWCYLFDGIFVGATKSAAMQNTMLFSTLAVYLPCWYFSQALGNHGLWLAFIAFNLARGLSLAGYFWLYTKQRRWC